MRLIARATLATYWSQHPDAQPALEHWMRVVKSAQWTSMNGVQTSFPKAKTLNRERARFEIAGGRFRLVCAFDFDRQVAFVKFIGTHAEYDRIDALTVSSF